MEQKTKKEFYLGRIILSAVIALFLFIGVFSFGYFVAFETYQSLASRKDVLSNSIIELQLQRELVGSSCTGDLGIFTEDLDSMISLMGELEDQLGKDNPEVIEQKKALSILEIQHYLLIEKRNTECNKKIPIILFFYSNEKEYIDRAEELGYILWNLKQSNPDVMIYSFDYDLESSLVETLKDVKGISSPNVIVVNGRVVKNIENVNDIKSALWELEKDKVWKEDILSDAIFLN